MDGGKGERSKNFDKGDFNARTGKERGKIEEGNVEKEERKKNIRVNGERKRLCRF